MIHVLPDESSILEMLSLMYGDNMTVTATSELNYNNTYAAVYVNADGETGAVCVCDIPFAAYSSGALTMMPPDAVKEVVSSQDLSEMHLANLYEVMNICTRLVISDNTEHLKLTEVLPISEANEHIEAVQPAGLRKDFEVSIPRYGSGTLSFMVT